jgi:hypothetical protein
LDAGPAVPAASAGEQDLARLGGADELAAYLKANDLVVVCGMGTFALEPTAGEPDGVGGSAESADSEPPKVERGVQLELPLPIVERRRGYRPQHRWTLTPWQDTLARPQKKETPSGLT